ncbi:hypothetical protein V8F33_010002 [Rhypophila sp. PSN 637]
MCRAARDAPNLDNQPLSTLVDETVLAVRKDEGAMPIQDCKVGGGDMSPASARPKGFKKFHPTPALNPTAVKPRKVLGSRGLGEYRSRNTEYSVLCTMGAFGGYWLTLVTLVRTSKMTRWTHIVYQCNLLGMSRRVDERIMFRANECGMSAHIASQYST